MSEFKDFQCKYCKKAYSSRKQLESTRCQSHPHGMWKGNHACDYVQGALAEMHNAHVRREQLHKNIDKQREKEKDKDKSYMPLLKNETLKEFYLSIIKHWDEDETTSTILELTALFTVGRDLLIPAGKVDSSWKDFFSLLQIKIADVSFWKFAYWMTRACEVTGVDIGEYSCPELIAKIKNNWNKDESIRLLNGVEKGLLKLEESAKQKDGSNKVDESWLPCLIELREKKIRDVEFWEGLYWVNRIVKIT
jgi:hypothetical protein